MPNDVVNPAVDFVPGQQVTLIFGGEGKLIHNKITLPGVITGIAASGNYNVRTGAEGVIIDISDLGTEHISARTI